MKKKQKSPIKCRGVLLYSVAILLMVWSGIILIFNAWDLTSDAVYQAHYVFPGLVSTDGKPTSSLEKGEYSGLAIDMEYRSRGAFVAGKKNPINISIKIQPLGKSSFFDEIKTQEKTIKFLFSNTRGYPTSINKYLGGPEPEAIESFEYDGKYLHGHTQLYYQTGGEFTPIIQYGTEQGKPITAHHIKGQKIVVAQQDVSLQLINNSRLFALTILIIGLTLIQIARQFS